MIDRRGFLGALAALAAAPFLPKPAGPYRWKPLLHADIWSVGPPLTEAQLVSALGLKLPSIYSSEYYRPLAPGEDLFEDESV